MTVCDFHALGGKGVQFSYGPLPAQCGQGGPKGWCHSLFRIWKHCWVPHFILSIFTQIWGGGGGHPYLPFTPNGVIGKIGGGGGISAPVHRGQKNFLDAASAQVGCSARHVILPRVAMLRPFILHLPLSLPMCCCCLCVPPLLFFLPCDFAFFLWAVGVKHRPVMLNEWQLAVHC